jgi:hypothetical protein
VLTPKINSGDAIPPFDLFLTCREIKGQELAQHIHVYTRKYYKCSQKPT